MRRASHERALRCPLRLEPKGSNGIGAKIIALAGKLHPDDVLHHSGRLDDPVFLKTLKGDFGGSARRR